MTRRKGGRWNNETIVGARECVRRRDCEKEILCLNICPTREKLQPEGGVRGRSGRLPKVWRNEDEEGGGEAKKDVHDQGSPPYLW